MSRSMIELLFQHGPTVNDAVIVCTARAAQVPRVNEDVLYPDGRRGVVRQVLYDLAADRIYVTTTPAAIKPESDNASEEDELLSDA